VIAHEAKLVHVLRVGGGLLDDRGLRVVLVVERAHGAPEFEPARVRGDVVVHLGSTLLAVVNDVDACTLEKPERVDGRPIVYLGAFQGPAAESLYKLLIAVDFEALSPTLCLGDVVVLERAASERLHPPGGLAETADLAGDESNTHTGTVSPMV
jgi:hypothetical protein